MFIRQLTGFSQRETITVGANPRQFGIGDFNGDGQSDVAVANFGSDTVTVLIGDRDRGFTPEATIPVGDGPDAVAAGDFNGDGRVDLAVSNLNSDTVQLLLRNAANTGFDAQARRSRFRTRRSTSPSPTSTATAAPTSPSRAT